MESSIHSFALTLERLLADVRNIIDRMQSHEAAEVEEFSIEDIEIEDDAFTPYLVGNKVKVLLQDIDRIKWRQELREDEELLVKLLRAAREVDVTRDEKLRRLRDQMAAKWASPINPGNRKVILFTAFADTAEYLYENTAEWAHAEFGIHSALVTGRTGGNKTTMAGIRKDLAEYLNCYMAIRTGVRSIHRQVLPWCGPC